MIFTVDQMGEASRIFNNAFQLEATAASTTIRKTGKLMTKHTEISAINRAQLLDDSLNFAGGGRLDYETVLNLTRYLEHANPIIVHGIPSYLAWIPFFTEQDTINN